MKLLLDTRVFLAVGDLGSVKLPEAVEKILTDQSSILHVSVASLWEIAIKVRSGKLTIGFNIEDLDTLCKSAAATILPITAGHVLGSVLPEPATRDPFDRLLLAQAEIEDMQLVTVDSGLVGHPLAWQAN